MIGERIVMDKHGVILTAFPSFAAPRGFWRRLFARARCLGVFHNWARARWGWRAVERCTRCGAVRPYASGFASFLGRTYAAGAA